MRRFYDFVIVVSLKVAEKEVSLSDANGVKWVVSLISGTIFMKKTAIYKYGIAANNAISKVKARNAWKYISLNNIFHINGFSVTNVALKLTIAQT